MKHIRYIFLTLFLVISMMMSAQRDGFFTESNNYENRGVNPEPTTTMTPTNFGQVDLGSGLLLLSIAGIGYALYKRRKVGITLLLCIVLMGCHKNQSIVNNRQTVDISLQTSGAKTQITPSGVVTWTSTDNLYLYSNTVGYIGQLTYAGDNVFTGSVYEWNTGDTLTFYYLGDNTPVEDKILRIDYSDQTNSNLSNISKHHHVSRCIASGVSADDRTFDGQMLNMMSIMYLNTQSFGNDVIKMMSETGLYNMIEIDQYGRLRYSVAGINTDVDNPSGHIVIGRGAQSQYVAVLPSQNLRLRFITNTRQSCDDLCIDISVSDFICNGSTDQPITITSTEYQDSRYIDYTILETHKFTINSDKPAYKKVVFPQGNLVYTSGRFKQHADAYSIVSNSDYTVMSDIDRFGWMTSSYNNQNLLFQPYTTSNVVTTKYKKYNGYGYGPYNGSNYEQSCFPGQNGTLRYRKCDWGWNQFGLDIYQQTSDGRYWRVLGNLEWEYLFDVTKRNRSLNNDLTTPLFGYCQIDTIEGCLILPDDWQDAYFTHPFAYGSTTFSDNLISVSEFNALQTHGAVFLPVDGYRSGRDIIRDGNGYYWGCKHSSNTGAGCLVIRENEVPHIEPMPRPTGAFVRLVYQTDGDVW